jgi:hypothetical protein
MIFAAVCILFEFGVISEGSNMGVILIVMIPPAFKFGPVMRKFLLRNYLLLRE